MLFAVAGLNGGCSLTSRFSKPSAPQVSVQPALTAAGRVDSLFGSSLPEDTLFLVEQPAVPGVSMAPGVTPLRLGPASMEVIGQETVWGWRVQLASSSDKKALEKIVSRVEREFGSTSYLVDLGGYWALRIGAFDNLDAAGRERERALSYGYKNAWIVQTGIPPYQIQHEE